MNNAGTAAPEVAWNGVAPRWLSVGVPLTLLLDLACLTEPGYPAILGQALAREGATVEPASEL